MLKLGRKSTGGWGISSCVARWKVEIPLSLGQHTIKFTATSQIRSVRTVSVNRSVKMYESYWSEPKTIGWASRTRMDRYGLGGEEPQVAVDSIGSSIAL